MQNEKDLIVKGTFIMFIGVILSKLFTYFYRILTARYIGPEGYGLLALGLSVFGIFARLSTLGVEAGITRYVSYFRGKMDNVKIKGTIYSAVTLFLPASAATTILLLVLTQYISLNIFNNPSLITILPIFAITLPFFAFMAITERLFTAFQKPIYSVLTDKVCQSLILFIVTAVLLYSGYGVFGAALAFFLSVVLTDALSLILFEKKVFPLIKSKLAKYTMRKELLMFSIPLIASTFAWMLVGKVDTIMLGYFKTALEVGQYNSAIPTAQLMFIIPTAIMSIFTPTIVKMFSEERKAELSKLNDKVFSWKFSLNLPFLAVFMLIPSNILYVLFGKEYVIASSALVILAFGYFIFSTFGQQTAALLKMIKSTKLVMYITAFLLGSNIILNYLLIPTYSANGAAIATTASFVSASFVYYIYGKKNDVSYSVRYLSKYHILIPLVFLPLVFFKDVILASFLVIVYYALFYKTCSKEDQNIIKSILRIG